MIHAIHILTRRKKSFDGIGVSSLGYVPSKISKFFVDKLDWIKQAQFKIYKGRNNYLVPVIGFFYERPTKSSRFSRIEY
jgi:hypothetical protein